MGLRLFRTRTVHWLPGTTLLSTGLVVAVVSLLAGCLTGSSLAPTRTSGDRLSLKLLPDVHFEDGAVLFIGVDGRAARYVDEGALFPLGIGLANQSQRSLTFHRESFVLQASDGSRYPLAGIEEFNRDYRRSRTDARLSDSFTDVLAARFANYTFVNRRLFPVRGSTATITNSFELGRRFWTHFYVYFPMPQGGIRGQRFNLLLEIPEVEETLVVSFFLE